MLQTRLLRRREVVTRSVQTALKASIQMVLMDLMARTALEALQALQAQCQEVQAQSQAMKVKSQEMKTQTRHRWGGYRINPALVNHAWGCCIMYYKRMSGWRGGWQVKRP